MRKNNLKFLTIEREFIERFKGFFAFLLIYAITTSNGVAFSQSECKNREDEWNPPSVGPITTWTAPVCEQGKLIMQPFFFFNRTRGFFDSESNYKSYVNKDSKWQWQEQLFLSYGLTNRWEIDALGTYQRTIAGTNTDVNDSFIFTFAYMF